MGLNLNNAAAFTGFLKGWNQEGDAQRTRAEEDRVRQNDQDMFGIRKALGENALALNDIGTQAAQEAAPMTLGTARESTKNFFDTAPYRQQQREFNNQSNQASLGAKQSVFTPDVQQGLFLRSNQSALQRAQEGIGIQDAQSRRGLYDSLLGAMNATNAPQVMRDTGLDKLYDLVPDSSGDYFVKQKGAPEGSPLIPLAVARHSLFNYDNAASLALNSATAAQKQQNAMALQTIKSSTNSAVTPKNALAAKLVQFKAATLAGDDAKAASLESEIHDLLSKATTP